MIKVNELLERIRICNSKLNDLQDQRENNAQEGNWTIVKAVKEQEKMVRFEKKILESVLTPEDFMDTTPKQGGKDAPYHNTDVD